MSTSSAPLLVAFRDWSRKSALAGLAEALWCKGGKTMKAQVRIVFLSVRNYP